MREKFLATLFLLALSPASVWPQDSPSCGPGSDPPRDCPVAGSPPGQSGALSFGTQSLTLLSNRKREREREAKENPQATRMLQVTSVDDNLAGMFVESTVGSWAFWGSGLHTRFNGTSSDLIYRANVNAVLIGIEQIFPAGHTAGVALGYDQINADMRFESRDVDGQEALAILYGAYLLDSTTSLDAAFSYSGTRVARQFRDSTNAIDGEYSGNRTIGTLNLSHAQQSGAVALTGHVGLLATRESQPSYTERARQPQAGTFFDTAIARRSLTLSQLNAALEAAYPLWTQGEAIGGLSYRYDLHRSDDDLVARGARGDKDEFEILLGGRYRITDQLTISAIATKIIQRRGYKSDSVQFTLRWDP